MTIATRIARAPGRAAKATVLLGANQAVGQLLAFVRNVVLARLVTRADFGIAATFAMTVALFDMASNFEPSIQLIQAEEGDDALFEGTAHSLEAIRGVLNALAILLAAWPLARLFHVPQVRLAFMALAICPLARGLSHLDRMRFQRTMRYLPYVSTEIAVSIAATVIVIPLALWFRNYLAMLFVVIAQAVLTTVASHVVAERPFRVAWQRTYARQMIAFGWPLIANGILLYVIIQGDRALVASAYGMELFAVYAAALNLTFVPTSAVFRAVGPVLLPLLARAQDDPPLLEKRFVITCQVLGCLAVVVAVPFLAAGGSIVRIVYGARYSAAGPFIGWLAAAQFVRMIRGAPATAALARGDSQNQMVANFWRALGVCAAGVVAWHHGGLASLAICGFMAEVVGCAWAVWELSRRHEISIAIFMRVTAAPILVAISAAILGLFLGHHSLGGLDVVVSGMATIIAVAVLMLLFGELRMRLAEFLFSRSEPTGLSITQTILLSSKTALDADSA